MLENNAQININHNLNSQNLSKQLDNNLSKQWQILARVPEHSLPLMSAISGAEPFFVDNYLFFFTNKTLIGIGYALASHKQNFALALQKAINKTHPEQCEIIAPSLPESLLAKAYDVDRYYLLATSATPPKNLKNILAKTESLLTIDKTREFSAAHRRLWSKFTNRVNLPQNVRLLYARIEAILKAENLYLLNAWTKDQQLAACMLIDTNPARFDSWVLGAHSKEFYVPHASDALFAYLLKDAKSRSKSYLNLGLGVNAGISRFKVKWGAKASLYQYSAKWAEESETLHLIMRSMQENADFSDAQIQRELEHSTAQRPFKMLWQLEKNGRISFIGGTAHFFRYSFETAFRFLFNRVDTVIFEGRLDEENLAAVDQIGKKAPDQEQCLANLMTEAEIELLDRIVCGRKGLFWKLLGFSRSNFDLRWHLEKTRPWFAFFSTWAAFLEHNDWHWSVDLEAWRVAKRLKKHIVFMENMEEQIEALEAVPIQRILKQFRSCLQWQAYLKTTVKAYLEGNLEAMIGAGAEFPTRSEQIIDARDQRFRERMREYLEEGRVCVLVGTAHLINLRKMLAEDGFKVTPMRQGFTPLRQRLRAALSKDAPIDPSGGLSW